MKTSILAAALFLSLSVNAEAATTFKSIVDVSQASNHANIPTEIDAGVYSVVVTIEASKANLLNNIALTRSVYRDDSQYICSIQGAFKVGTATILVKSLVNGWESTNTQDINVTFGSEENDSVCRVDTKLFEGIKKYRIVPNGLALELPVKDMRFSSVKLAINPLVDGFDVDHELLAGDSENTLKVFNPGKTFETALAAAGDNRISYALTLTANGYYHFDTEYSVAEKTETGK